MKKNRILAVLLNLFTGGLGYVYLGKRKLFGWMIFIGVLLSFVWYFTFPFSKLVVENIWIILSSLVFLIALAFDAYKEAK